MTDYGAIQPVVVRRVRDSYEILGNVETWMAAQQLQLERVPIHVLEHLSEEEAAEIIGASFDGYTSDPIDEAEYFQSQILTEGGSGRSKHKTVANLSHRTGHSRTYISHALRLLKLPLDIQDLVRAGRLTAGHARALVSLKTHGAQRALAKRAVANRLTVRQTESLARDLRDGKPTTSRNWKDPESPAQIDSDTRRLQRRIAEQLGCAVSIDTAAARLLIDYYNLEILDGVLGKLGISE